MGRRGRSNVINVCFVSCETTVRARARAREESYEPRVHFPARISQIARGHVKFRVPRHVLLSPRCARARALFHSRLVFVRSRCVAINKRHP